LANKTLRIGTRGSALALWQANFISGHLKARAGVECEICVIKTQGDKIDNVPFSKMEGKGFFTKEIEKELLDCNVDLAVHSMKDLETVSPAGLIISAVGFREDPRDVIVAQKGLADGSTPLGIKRGLHVGTSSERRKCQVLYHDPEIQISDLRGNVPTRLEKLRRGDHQVILLANAGIRRLEIDLSEFDVSPLDPEIFVPAPAQGVLALQTRADDGNTNDSVGLLNDPEVRTRIDLERGLLARFEGGCQLPFGAYSTLSGTKHSVVAVLGYIDESGERGIRKARAEGSDVKETIETLYTRLTDCK